MTDRYNSPVTFLEDVRGLYESLPFPTRDPEDERKRMIITPPDALGRINHYCFQGRQTFGPGFRAFVAGGGTGDATLFLAEQLSRRGGEVVHLDMSSASMEVAKKRAAVRGLKNIQWVHASILDIPGLGLGRFDYINCVGVLHHMEDPAKGLRCLESVLSDSGAIALMVYGRYGRLGVTVVQDMLKIILSGETDLGAKINTANALLGSLLGTNAYMKGRLRDAVLKSLKEDPGTLADTFLHPCDQPFTVTQLHAMVEQCGLRLALFTSFRGDVTRLQYDAQYLAQDPALKQRLALLPLPVQQQIAEMMDGNLHLHTAYLARRTENISANFNDCECVPFVPSNYAAYAIHLLCESGSDGLNTELNNGGIIHIRLSPLTLAFLRAMDGRRTAAEIFVALNADGDAARTIIRDLEFLNKLDWVLLRHRSVDPFLVADDPQTVDLDRLGPKPWKIPYASIR